jgi:phospholipid transport system substrate-binding protein
MQTISKKAAELTESRVAVHANDQVMVRQLVQPSGDINRFDYILRQGKDGWRIIIILADGVSDPALKRVEYRVILQQ